MLHHTKVTIIDHDWSLYRLFGRLGGTYFDNTYAIIHDEDAISDDFWKSVDRVCQSVINRHLGEKLEAYYE